ncbi:acyltransferase family protein [Actinomadura latina]|uniref:Acyltransferase family protein n=2 Tax=Actinomadura latina TaxID=163603 RepID=A0A846YRC1_9ACTN|nr:lysophospholipid acyltransferase family protein [Actinomadura latina]NKZ02681.1 acyltransferase family protein [Actinomadura latina]
MNARHLDDGDEGAQVIQLDTGHHQDSAESGAEQSPLERTLASGLAFLRRRLAGDYEVDEFGFDPEFNSTLLLPFARALYEHWFRIELSGLENVPEGGALLVANHSGTVPLDALMLTVALHDNVDRCIRLLGADLVYQIPVLGHLARKAGHTLACQADASRLLAKGELVGVFPEGFKGVGKPFADRYKLQRFGRGGFVGTALRAGAPIVPCAIVGAEETYPKIADLRPLARLLGLPYFPITPTFPLLGLGGLIPLPSRWVIQFGAPMTLDEYEPDDADDPMTVFEITDHVRENIQHMLYEALMRRGPAFL